MSNPACAFSDNAAVHPNQGRLTRADRGGKIGPWDLGERKGPHQVIGARNIRVGLSHGMPLAKNEPAPWS
jgi:hypothetical protein